MFTQLTDIGILVGIAVVAYVVNRVVVVPLVVKAAARTPTRWDDIVTDRRLQNRGSLLIPLVVLRTGLALVVDPATDPTVLGVTNRVLEALIVIVALLLIGAALSAADRAYMKMAGAANRPIKGYLQATRLLVWLFGLIVVIARLADQPVGALLAGLGAVSAVLLLVFRDTLLSLTASVQLSNADLLRLGDWIEVPDQSANGIVEDISLLTVRVRNFDNTVTAVPTYHLVSSPFKNWRGMIESGARRMQRSINIDAGTVRYLTAEELTSWREMPLVGRHVKERSAVIDQGDSDHDQPPKGMTNIGVFRVYVESYLRSHPRIIGDRQILVRQRDPQPNGVPIELYAFIDTVLWEEYEAIQSDIFDHLLASVGAFGLRIHQSPTGADLSALLSLIHI